MYFEDLDTPGCLRLFSVFFPSKSEFSVVIFLSWDDAYCYGRRVTQSNDHFGNFQLLECEFVISYLLKLSLLPLSFDSLPLLSPRLVL